MVIAVMLSLISCITAFSQTDYRTDVVLTIEESTSTTTEPIQSVSNPSETLTASNDSITSLNKDNSYVQTGSVLFWSLPLIALAAICVAFVIVRTNELKK